MKRNYLLGFSLLLFAEGFISAQVPDGYYNDAQGLTGYELKTELFQIIGRGYVDLGYSGLWLTYKTSDIDRYYENDGTILDIYSENPGGPDAYEYQWQINQNTGGSTAKEGLSYNREHIVPQSYFNEAAPMHNDAHFIVPTDGHVNGVRNNFPYGNVGSATFTSDNGTKVGEAAGATPNYTGIVAEPINEFKGDVARMILYFVTRYEDKISTFPNNNDMLQDNKDGLTSWEKNILLQWSYQDPVSQREIDRNNAIYDRQLNRNPFIDHPEYIKKIWGDPFSTDNNPPTAPTDLAAKGSPDSGATMSWTASSDDVAVKGYDIYFEGKKMYTSPTPSVTMSNLDPNTTYNVTIQAFDQALNYSAFSQNFTLNISALGTDEINAHRDLKVYADSFTRELIVTGIGLQKVQNAWIYSAEGRMIQSISNPFRNSNKIDIGFISSGIYFLKLDTTVIKFIVK